MESADAVRSHLNIANEEIFKEIQSTERLQKKVYLEFLDLLTNDLFFIPILQSRSKEIVGRFCINSRIAVHCVYRTYGTSDFLDSPGHFEIKFTSSGLEGVSAQFDQYFSQSLTTHLSPYVQNSIRFMLSTKGWKCWWRDGLFCFQAAADTKLIEEAGLLASLYPVVLNEKKEPAHRSSLCLLPSNSEGIW